MHFHAFLVLSLLWSLRRFSRRLCSGTVFAFVLTFGVVSSPRSRRCHRGVLALYCFCKSFCFLLCFRFCFSFVSVLDLFCLPALSLFVQ